MKMVCKNCGLPVDEGLKFCTNCGTPVAEASPHEQVSIHDSPDVGAYSMQEIAAQHQNNPESNLQKVETPPPAPPKAKHTKRNVMIAVVMVGIVGIILGTNIAANRHFERGKTYLREHDYENAINEYSLAIKLKPNYALAYVYRGDAHELKGQYDRAIEDLNKAIELDPHYVDLYGNRGEVYRMKSQYDRAIEDLNKAIELSPDYQWAKDRLREIRGR
jgi:tetratricopeptide (TPR) repeat protein